MGRTDRQHRTIPFGFFGTDLDPQVAIAPAGKLDRQMRLMARSGVESVRTNFYWSSTEPQPGVYDWAVPDAIVTAAARHGESLLPVIEFTPRWASTNPGSPEFANYMPRNVGNFSRFMRAVVARYGPRGTFWFKHPRLRFDPIRYWQIWNEPAGVYDWASQPWPTTYTRLLRAGYEAVHDADRGGKVVSGAAVGLYTDPYAWGQVKALYRAGAKRYFDVLAVNSYTNAGSAAAAADNSLAIVARVRSAMNHHGDRRTPVWVTEVTWTAALGKISPSQYTGFESTPRGQAARLSTYFRTLVAKRASLGVGRVYWYTWASSYRDRTLFGNPASFQYAGLVKYYPGSPFRPMPLLATYSRVTDQLESRCARTDIAGRCR